MEEIKGSGQRPEPTRGLDWFAIESKNSVFQQSFLWQLDTKFCIPTHPNQPKSTYHPPHNEQNYYLGNKKYHYSPILKYQKRLLYLYYQIL